MCHPEPLVGHCKKPLCEATDSSHILLYQQELRTIFIGLSVSRRSRLFRSAAQQRQSYHVRPFLAVLHSF